MEIFVTLQSEKDEKGTAVLFFFYHNASFSNNHMTTAQIKDAISPLIVARGLFLVDLKISKDNDITITVESEKGTVTLDDCEAINRSFTGMFSQDEEDYSLTVTSAGLDSAFKVQAQYMKAIGGKVEVWFKGGMKVIGVLEKADADKVTVDGQEYELKNINKVKYYLEF